MNKAIEHLEAIRAKCGEELLDGAMNLLAMECRTLATKAVEQLKRSPWTPVSKGMPQANGGGGAFGTFSRKVLVLCSSGKITIGFFDHERRLWHPDLKNRTVVGWMELPPAVPGWEENAVKG